MALYEIMLQVGLATSVLVAYLIFFRRSSPSRFKGNYRQPGWNYLLRQIVASFAVKKWKAGLPLTWTPEHPRGGQTEGWDAINIRAMGSDGSALVLTVRRVFAEKNIAEVTVHLKLSDGTTYRLPQHPDTAVGPFESNGNFWSAAGLKIQVLQEKERLRILYNGLLKRDSDNVTQYCRFSFIWAAATDVVRHPEDWSVKLAAKCLALEPWRDGKWPYTLSKWGGGSWLQWGTVQGRFTSYNEGVVDTTEYLRLRGVRERSWSPQGYRGLLRSVVITAAAKDGTAIQLRGFSYKKVLTEGFCGSVRLPNYQVQSLTDTDLVLSEFCELPDGIPSVYTLNASSADRDFNIVLRINSDGGKVRSGVPYQHEVVYRTASVSINGEHGTAIMELGYAASEKTGPPIDLSQKRLRWARESEVGSVGYCVSFEERGAACTDHVGGKGASLALLASVQDEQGYRVPPGFCVTTKALEKHLQANPAIKAAIEDIRIANENYEENNFKEKCNRAVELFIKTEIVDEVKEEIFNHLQKLRKKSSVEKLGSQLSFAVRSSAVGEDSEALSAAGQNETVLGCVADSDVIAGVQKCWASMFAFTSAHYRRQNGQACLCRGAVVVQTLALARAAGVMFTRHPDGGDPTRLLITANYGLGETVVSGSVEPDTILVTRNADKLTVSKIEIGSKTSRMTSAGGAVASELVSEQERTQPCLSETEILKLARIGLAQDKLWGAGRDIEWAVVKDEIYLLQARPITSLERWSEEELLHELDFPIMSDDELITFANTGEVMPKPLTAMSYDLVYETLSRGIEAIMFGLNGDGYDRTVCITHNRCVLPLYNTVYRRVPDKINLVIRVLEMALHGHKVSNENTIAISRHRQVPSIFERLMIQLYGFKYLFFTKKNMDDQTKLVNKMRIDTDTDSPTELLTTIAALNGVLTQCSSNHASSTSGGTVAQAIAMSVLVEGADDFTTEQCNEINILLSSGGVLSAEVPQALANLTRKLEESGRAEDFRKQDPKNALGWLQANLPEFHQDVSKFLEEHGHRAIMELDLATKPWVLVPEEMMKVLQNMRLSNQVQSAPKSDAEIVASLKTTKKPNTKKVIKWLIPLCRRAVRHREATKGYYILAIHKVRLALFKLGKLCVKHWYLPDEDLVFHFRIKELQEFLLTRDPALLRKAIQRRQFHPSWCKLKFEELYTGWPQPVQQKAHAVTAADFRLNATSVCGGEVIARACVVKDLSEIGQLQRGDVLITHSTDIGWSPYFPLLTGIVTELGGLISHGAVIAREYGLPCIVGAAHATDLFRTGDQVRLSGDRGFIEKVQVEPTSETSSE